MRASSHLSQRQEIIDVEPRMANEFLPMTLAREVNVLLDRCAISWRHDKPFLQYQRHPPHTKKFTKKICNAAFKRQPITYLTSFCITGLQHATHLSLPSPSWIPSAGAKAS
jgi:hypothetical protein